MNHNISSYFVELAEITEGKISSLLLTEVSRSCAKEAFNFHFSDHVSRAFQYYYCEIVDNCDGFLLSSSFFRKFKQMYALQGIDNGYLDSLEEHKGDILRYILSDRLTPLYLQYFAAAPIRHGNSTIPRNLGSFFTKLTHTFRPEEYCALDNPVKSMLGLRKDGFYTAFYVASEAYRQWILHHPDRMNSIRLEFDADAERRELSPKMTDIKLLDLVLWHHANVIG